MRALPIALTLPLLLLPAGGLDPAAVPQPPPQPLPGPELSPPPEPAAPEVVPPPPEPWAVSLGVRETQFRYRGGRLTRGRAHNLRRAAGLLDGAVIPAGGELGYNGLLGPRTLDRGWRTAKAFLRGEVIEQPGGGICQVSSTLHAAALRAGLVATSQRAHSRAVPYIEPGLDATVSWERPDLVLFNPHPFPVRVAATEPEPGLLRVEVLGKARLWDVRVALTDLEREDPPVSFRKRDDRPMGWQRIAEPGSPTLTVSRVIERRARGTGDLTREEAEISYGPLERVIELGVAPPEP